LLAYDNKSEIIALNNLLGNIRDAKKVLKSNMSEYITLKTKEKKTFTVPKEGRTFQFKCKNYNRFWFSDVTEKINNTTVRYDISSVNANLPKNDDKHIYGNFSASSIKDNILTVTINPNNLGIKRYIDVAVTAGDVFDNIYFEQE